MKDPREPYELGFQNLARTVEGRAFLWQLFESSGLFLDAFAEDPLRMAYNCGAQSVTRPLLDILMEQQPQLFAKLIEENTKQ